MEMSCRGRERVCVRAGEKLGGGIDRDTVWRQEDIHSWHGYITSSRVVLNPAEDGVTEERRGCEGCVTHKSLLRDTVVVSPIARKPQQTTVRRWNSQPAHQTFSKYLYNPSVAIYIY